MYRIQRLDFKQHFSEQVNFEAVSRVIPANVVEEVIAECGAEEERSRKLPAALTVWLCLLMNIFSGIGLQAVLVRMVRGTRLVAGAGLEVTANKSSISKARYRLGVEPLRRLFSRLCQPLASPNDPTAFRYGLRLIALDSTVEQAADTAANQAVFGRQPGTRNSAGSAFPQVRCVYACECGTHAIFDAIFMPYRTGDIHGVRQLLRCIDHAMLVMLDAGLFGADLIATMRDRGSHILCRVSSAVRPRCEQRLADGSYLSHLTVYDAQRRPTGQRVPIRVIDYTFDDPQRPGYPLVHRLLTTLLDPVRYPALDLICLFHERWEIELTIDELDTHQRLLSTPLHSHKPEGVLQELYGLLLAHYLIRAIMYQAARTVALDPDRLSFVTAIRLISDAVADFQLIDPAQHPQLWLRLLNDLVYTLLPLRDNRINPRVVKRQRTIFAVKKPHHLHPPQPLKSFRAGVVVLPQPFTP
jgi:hypothetical protein